MNTSAQALTMLIAASPRLVRKRLGMTQMEFWRPLGVHQAVGSRYESGRAIPMPVQLLLELAYGDEQQSGQTLASLRRRSGNRPLPRSPRA